MSTISYNSATLQSAKVILKNKQKRRKGAVMWLGIDNGTHSSSVGYVDKNGNMHLIFGIPSVLFFPPFNKKGNKETFYGKEAVEEFHEYEGQGNLVFAFKSLLGTGYPGQNFKGYPGTWNAIKLTSLFLFKLKQLAESSFGQVFNKVVLGRPANFSETAQSELTQAALDAGFVEIRLEPEPLAAALTYTNNTKLDFGETFAVVDLGGGTTDIALIEWGKEGAPTIGGIGIAGNAFNSAITRNHLLKYFGLGATYGHKKLSVPVSPIKAIADWRGMRFVDGRTFVGIEHDSSDPAGVGRLQKIYQNRLGYRFYESVDAGKMALSVAYESKVTCPALDLNVSLTRAQFEAYIQPELRKIAQVISRTLARAQKQSNEVKTVILTGGTSQTPIVQELVKKYFPKSKILFPDPFATVGGGLALKASLKK